MFFNLVCSLLTRLPFGAFIEGAGVDANGIMYFTHANNETGTIGDLNGHLYSSNASLQFNGIKFVNDKEFYAVEVNENKIYYYKNGFTAYCEHPMGRNGMSNDIALVDDIVYVSGQRYRANTTIGDGELWMCKNGHASVIDRLGRTNGIAITPNKEYLYLSEAFNENFTPISNKIYKYKIVNNTLESKVLAIDFELVDQSQGTDIDGIRFDVDGKLYVTRNGLSKISVFKDDVFVKNIPVSFQFPANLEIVHNKLFVAGRCGKEYGIGPGCLDIIDVDAEGAVYSSLRQTMLKSTSYYDKNADSYKPLIIGISIALFFLIILIVVFVRRSFIFRRVVRRQTTKMESNESYSNEETLLPYVPKLRQPPRTT